MSNVPQGPGWWIASDGQWYPPESHPSAVATPAWAPELPVPARRTRSEFDELAPLPPLSAVVTACAVAAGGANGQAPAPSPGAPAGWAAPLAPARPLGFGTAPTPGPTAPLGYGPAPRLAPPGFTPPGYGPYPYGTPPGAGVGPLASWSRRVGAYFIDGLVLYIPTEIFIRLLITTGHYDSLIGFIEPHASGGQVLTSILLLWGPALAYFGFLNGWRGQTVGKMAVGICVRDARTGAPIGILRGIAREGVVVFLGAIPLVLVVHLVAQLGLLALALDLPIDCNYLWPLFDARNQAWHDKVVGSVVLRRAP
jgi:uncharacterized RDD family membrane protein YckC